jgi:hypothetical protein
MIVDGIVPKMPPTFVPYFSAITVMMMTISAESTNGTADCKIKASMK